MTFFLLFFEVGWVGSEAEAAGLLTIALPAVGFAQPSAGREGQHLPARSNSIRPMDKKFIRGGCIY